MAATGTLEGIMLARDVESRELARQALAKPPRGWRHLFVIANVLAINDHFETVRQEKRIVALTVLVAGSP